MSNGSHDRRMQSRQERKRQVANRRKLGFDLELPVTSLMMDERIVARVRVISLSEQAERDLIPDHLQGMVNDGMNELGRARDEAQQRGDGPLTYETLDERYKTDTSINQAVDAFCVATFITPRLGLTEQEAQRLEQDDDYWRIHAIDPDDREVWTVDMVELEDRHAWFFTSLDRDRLKAAKLKPFRPRSVIDVAHRPTEPVHAPTSVHAAQPEDRAGLE